MAFTITELIEETSTANGTSYATTGTYVPTANGAMIACVEASGTVAATPTASGNGATWTLEAVLNDTTHSVYIFSAPSGASPTTTAFTFTCSSDAATGVVITVLDVVGADTSNVVVQSATDLFGASGTANPVFASATDAGCAVVGNLRNNTSPAGVTQPTGYTESTDTGYSTPTSGGEVAYHTSPGSFTSLSWGGTSATAGQSAAVEIKSGATSLTAVALSATASLPAASLKQDTSHTAVVISATPSLPAAALKTDLTAVALSASVSLPAAQVGPGVTAVALSASPSLPAAALATSITAVALSATPSLPAATVSEAAAGQDVTAVVLAATPSLPAAALTTSLTGVALSATPSLPAAALGTSITAVALSATPSQPAATLGNSLTSIVLAATPSLPAATVLRDTSHTAVALSATPSLPAAALETSLTAVALSATPSLPAAALGTSITAVALAATPTMPAAAITVAGDLSAVVLTATPSLPAARVDQQITYSPIYDAVSKGSGSTGNLSWTHTPRTSGALGGILVFVIHGSVSTDQVSSVTYGGVTMTEVANSPLLSSGGSAVYAYHLGSSIPTGAQTVAVTVSGATIKHPWAISFTSPSGSTAVDATATIDSLSVDDPTISLTTTKRATIAGGLFSGIAGASHVIAGTGYLEVGDVNFGTSSASIITSQLSVSPGALSVPWVSDATDEAAGIAVALYDPAPAAQPIVATPTLPAASISTAVEVTAVALSATPTLPAAATKLEILAAVIAATPAMPAASLAISVNVTAVALVQTPIFPIASAIHSNPTLRKLVNRVPSRSRIRRR